MYIRMRVCVCNTCGLRTTRKLGVPTSHAIENPRITFDFTTDSLLLTKSLTNNINSQLTHTLYLYYILYSHNEVG